MKTTGAVMIAMLALAVIHMADATQDEISQVYTHSEQELEADLEACEQITKAGKR